MNVLYQEVWCSTHVIKLIDDYTAEVEAGTAPMTSERIPLQWPGYTSYSMSDYRVALAVAGGGLFLDYKKTSSGYTLLQATQWTVK